MFFFSRFVGSISSIPVGSSFVIYFSNPDRSPPGPDWIDQFLHDHYLCSLHRWSVMVFLGKIPVLRIGPNITVFCWCYPHWNPLQVTNIIAAAPALLLLLASEPVHWKCKSVPTLVATNKPMSWADFTCTTTNKHKEVQ